MPDNYMKYDIMLHPDDVQYLPSNLRDEVQSPENIFGYRIAITFTTEPAKAEFISQFGDIIETEQRKCEWAEWSAGDNSSRLLAADGRDGVVIYSPNFRRDFEEMRQKIAAVNNMSRPDFAAQFDVCNFVGLRPDQTDKKLKAASRKMKYKDQFRWALRRDDDDDIGDLFLT